MRKTSTYLYALLALIVIVSGPTSFAQMIGDQVFLQGKWVEAGIAPNGSMGSTRLVPSGFHTRCPINFNMYDPGLSAFTGASYARLMMTYDAQHDGWSSGTPPFFGDYSFPGTPYEGWGIQINGSHSEAHCEYYNGTTTTGFAGAAGLTGTNVSYSISAGLMTTVWQGTAGPSGALQIIQIATLDTLASWVKFRVKLKNTGSTPLTNIYYCRETDPDNDEAIPFGSYGSFGTCGGSFTTVNTIDHQGDYYHRVQVTGRATCITDQTLSMSTKDCRAKCYIQAGWPMSTGTSLASVYSGSGVTMSGTVTGDVAIGLVYNLGTIAAGDSTELNYAYVFNGLLGIDSAIANPQIVVNGIPRDSVDTVTSCSFSGSSLACSIINGDAADWFGSTWTWAPSTYLATTTGLTNTVAVSSITSPITYTITGTTAISGCSGKLFLLTVMPPGTTPAPTASSVSYCLGAATVPLSASGTGTIWWWTTPTGGTGTTVAPTPSSATVGTTTWYVSQVVAGCPSPRVAVTVTIFALSTPITGSQFVCTGYTTTLANATSGGTWVSGTPAIATVGSSSGIVSGVSPGTAAISYLVSGCVATVTVTVTTTPAPITGIMIACLGATTTLANSVPGGSWSSSNTGIATVGSSTGIVTGVALGTATITYNMGGGCYITANVTVNPYPAAITGSMSLCVGATTTLSSTTPGGLWTSSAPGIASVGVATGIVNGNSAGTATISYRVSGCAVTAVVTVVTAATPIIGPSSVCVGSTITLTNSTTGGTWNSSTPAIATIGASSGIVTGISSTPAPGTTTITYSLSAGCTTTKIITVTAAPAAIGGTLSVCQGLTTTLTHPVSGGIWASSTPATATIDPGTGVVTGVSATAPGTTTITYTLPSGCFTTSVFTVNPLPGAITGTMTMCQGGTTTLSSATPGGTWGSSAPTVATVDATTGIVTGSATGSGTSTITYTLPTGCITTAVVTVNATPAPITGAGTVCVGNTLSLGDPTPFGGWSSSTTAVGTVSGSGVVTGIAGGTTTITYALASGCYTTAVVSVNAGPSAITGTLAMCVGFTTTLADATPGGTWSSSAPAIASVLSPGLIGGSAPGTATISYTVSGCAATAVVSVNPLPGAITGPSPMRVCVGQTITLANSTPGGSWSSSTPGVASVGSSTGIVTGVAAIPPGTATITYALGSSGCQVTAVVSVNPVPSPITGTTNICEGVCTPLSSLTPSGTWASSTPSVATISSGGSLCGIVTGTATISYTLSSGCYSTVVASVNALPPVITGSTSVCIGQCNTLSSGAGGTWSASNGNITIGATTGSYCGVFAGTSIVTYTSASGCYRTITVLINPLPTISGTPIQVCEGSTIGLTGSPSFGTWASSTPAVGTIGLGTGTLGGIAPGTTIVTYTAPSTCYATTIATVNGLPSTYTGSLTTCVGQTTVLGSTPSGGAWASSNTAVATVSGGTVSGVSGGAGSLIATISYTLPTGCRRQMNVTVYALPGIITGSAQVCEGSTTTLSCTPIGGTWTSSAPSVATVVPTTGVVTGVSSAPPGTATITYTVGTGCTRTTTVTVAPLPTPITGSAATCVGQTTALASTPTGGSWLSGTTTVATVDATGLVTGVSGGSGSATSIITYTAPNTCRATVVATVYTLPAPITGNFQVCQGSTNTLGTTTPGGTWSSSNTAIATVDASGNVTGVSSAAPGTATITYALGTGCYKTATVTVSPLPAAITGPVQVCEGATITLSNTTPGGSWVTSTPSVAIVGSGSGIVTGISGAPGTATATISYTLPTTCSRTYMITVHQIPAVISGPSVVCKNSTITLSTTPPGGAWSSSDGTIATVSGTGVVTGINPGAATITYTQGIGCFRTKVISVNALPNAITGNQNVCIGLTTTLATTSGGGSWNSSNTTVATVDAGGVVTGVAATPAPATSTISYTFTSTGCASTVNVTVHPLPSAIVGPDAFCNLSTANYSSTPTGGTWASADASILTINPVTGAATGVLPDTTDIIYTSPAGCTVTKTVFLILAPYPITGVNDVCLGQTAVLSNVIGGGTWATSSPGIVPIISTTPTTATIQGVGIGTGTISYTLSSGCFSIKNETVNPIPSGTSGPTQVCEASCVTLVNTTPGGTWVSSDPAIATIGSASGVTCGTSGGTVILTYALGTGCNAQFVLTVNALPAVITGNPQVCEGTTTVLASSPAGGGWNSSHMSVADVDPSTGLVTGVSATMPGIPGPGMANITYTLPTGCIRIQNVTVNPGPNATSGPTNACVGTCVVLSNGTPGGAWVSSNPAIATVDASGTVCGIAPGSVVISYILPTSCIATFPFVVSTNPDPISGSLSVCAGFATNLTSAPTPGSWSQDPLSTIYGTINPITGVVSGIMAGTIPITYTLPSGCSITNTVTVVTLPAVISGNPQVCVGGTTTLTNPVAGGTWSISNPAKGTIDATTGVLTGISAGTAVVTYSVGTGCFNVLTVSVNPLPGVITGPLQVCEGSQITLSSSTPGGLWISGSTANATVGYVSGVVTGVAAGVAPITYSLATGCMQQVDVTVNVTPPAITGNFHVCIGSANTLSNAMAGGIWQSSNPAVATVNPSTGVVTPVTLGTAIISYVLPVTGCMATHTVTVQPLPVVYNVTGGGNYCAGGSGVLITLSGSQIGVSYVLYNGSIATGYMAGTGSPISFGMLTASGTYTVQATNVTSGCMKDMAGSASVVITPLVTPVVTIAASPSDSVCPGETVMVSPVTTTGGTAPTYTWKVNGVTVSTANTYSFIPSNGDVVTVRMASNMACLAAPTATGTKTLTVLPTALPAVTVTSDPNDTVCQYNPVTFTVHPSYGGTSPVYAWMVNGTAVGTGVTYSYVPQDGDNVYCTMSSNYRCRMATTVASENIIMSVDSLIIPHVNVYPAPGFIVEAGKPVTLRAEATNAGSAPKYQWKVNGVAIPGATLRDYTAIFHDYDSVTCMVTSSGVCANIGTHGWVFITVTPLGSSHTAATGSSLQLVPNPNRGIFTIRGTLGTATNEVVNVEVTDMLGQVVYRGEMESKQGRVEGTVRLDNSLANGMYILTLRSGEQQQMFHFVLEQ